MFNHSSWPGRLASTGYLLAGEKWMSRHVRQVPSKLPTAAKGYLRSERTFGTPGFPKATAREAVERRLEQLGYR